MARPTRADLLSRVYHDPKNYPYGFSRSGDFSINEAKALTKYGNLVSGLCNGSITPETQEDEDLLAVANGEKAPDTVAEKAWAKYIKRINRAKTGSIYGRRISQTEDSDDTSSGSTDSDLDTDTDIALADDEA